MFFLRSFRRVPSISLPRFYSQNTGIKQQIKVIADLLPPSYAESPESSGSSLFPDENPEPAQELNASNLLQSNWSTSFEGIGSTPFNDAAVSILLAPIDQSDIEVKPDGLIYLPEIKYRRILNRAFKPGGWGLAPRGPHTIINKTLTREYALIVNGRFVSQSRGEQDFFSPEGLPTATEGVKSNALMRCCKDLGIASELWDPIFIRRWKAQNAVEVWATDVRTKQKRKLWRRKDDKLSYPYQEQ